MVSIKDRKILRQMLAILFYVVLYNRMMVYVENHAYRATPDKETETKN